MKFNGKSQLFGGKWGSLKGTLWWYWLIHTQQIQHLSKMYTLLQVPKVKHMLTHPGVTTSVSVTWCHWAQNQMFQLWKRRLYSQCMYFFECSSPRKMICFTIRIRFTQKSTRVLEPESLVLYVEDPGSHFFGFMHHWTASIGWNRPLGSTQLPLTDSS